MTNNPAWLAIKTLVDCDKNLIDIHEKLILISKKIANLLDQKSNFDALLITKKNIIFEEKKVIKQHELQASEIKTDEDKKCRQRDAVTDQKQFAALAKEIEALTEKRMLIEETILHQWQVLEDLETEFTHLEKNKDAKITQLSDEINQHEHEKTVLEKQLHSLQSTIDETRKLLPTDWLSNYDRMKNSVQDPIVTVINNACGGCFYNVPHPDMIKVKKAELVVCRSCYRFMYFNPPEVEQYKAATY